MLTSNTIIIAIAAIRTPIRIIRIDHRAIKINFLAIRIFKIINQKICFCNITSRMLWRWMHTTPLFLNILKAKQKSIFLILWEKNENKIILTCNGGQKSSSLTHFEADALQTNAKAKIAVTFHADMLDYTKTCTWMNF